MGPFILRGLACTSLKQINGRIECQMLLFSKVYLLLVFKQVGSIDAIHGLKLVEIILNDKSSILINAKHNLN